MPRGQRFLKKMASLEELTEVLIDNVRNYPVLYDTNHADYKNTRLKYRAWDDIAEIVGGSGEILKSKWKNLRDAYGKHLRANQTRTGQASKLVERYRTWPWAQQMSFLRPYIEATPTHSKQGDLEQATSHQETESYMADLQSPPLLQHRRKASDLTDRQTDRQIETQVDKAINFLHNTDLDDIDLVFLGYAKTIKKMSKSRQANVKFRIAKVIMEAELEQDRESSYMLQASGNDGVFIASNPIKTAEDTDDSS